MTKTNERANILEVKSSDRYHTIDELFKGIFSRSTYYTLLVLSAIVVTAGILLNNIPIVIGGMLIAPMLTPLLVAALSLSVRSWEPIKSMGSRILVSLAVISGIALLTALAFGLKQTPTILEISTRSLFLYFFVALASGVAATFAWVHKEISEILPGVAITVSLLPPLALVGVWTSVHNWGLVQFFGLVFISNLFGIILGSYIVFRMLKFGRFIKDKQEVDKDIKKVEKDIKKAE